MSIVHSKNMLWFYPSNINDPKDKYYHDLKDGDDSLRTLDNLFVMENGGEGPLVPIYVADPNKKDNVLYIRVQNFNKPLTNLKYLTNRQIYARDVGAYILFRNNKRTPDEVRKILYYMTPSFDETYDPLYDENHRPIVEDNGDDNVNRQIRRSNGGMSTGAIVGIALGGLAGLLLLLFVVFSMNKKTKKVRRR